MKAFVLTDAALERHAGRFVWLSVDTEREENAPFIEKYPIEAWPTVMVIDPSSERPVVRHLGAPTIAQLELLLGDGERALAARGETPDALLAQANEAAVRGDHPTAAELGKRALHVAPLGWPARNRALEFVSYELSAADLHQGCLELIRAELARLPRSLTRAVLATQGMSCASELKLPEAVAELRAVVADALAPPPLEMSSDDRSSFYEVLVVDLAERGDELGQQRLAAEWARMLEEAAARAKTIQERTVFDSHRLSAYAVLGTLEKLLPVLEEHERALPDDFNPPARLAYAYRRLGRLEEALAASDRALALAQGPRRLRILREKSEVLAALKRPEEARAVLRDALAHHDRLPRSQQYPRTRAAIEQRLGELK